MRAAPTSTPSARRSGCAGPDATGALYVRDPEALRAAARRLLRAPSRTTSPRRAGSRRRARARFDTAFTPRAVARRARGGARRSARQGASSARASSRSAAASCCSTAVTTVVTEPGRRRSSRCARRRHGGGGGALYERGVIIRELPGTGLLRASVGWWNDEQRPRAARRGARGASRSRPVAGRARRRSAAAPRRRSRCARRARAEELRALVDVVARDARRERRLLQLLPHRLRLEPVEPRGPDEAAGVDEADSSSHAKSARLSGVSRGRPRCWRGRAPSRSPPRGSPPHAGSARRPAGACRASGGSRSRSRAAARRRARAPRPRRSGRAYDAVEASTARAWRSSASLFVYRVSVSRLVRGSDSPPG